eukprot:Clim_evm28s143 gene=Clim_evmTU28s143
MTDATPDDNDWDDFAGPANTDDGQEDAWDDFTGPAQTKAGIGDDWAEEWTTGGGDDDFGSFDTPPPKNSEPSTDHCAPTPAPEPTTQQTSVPGVDEFGSFVVPVAEDKNSMAKPDLTKVSKGTEATRTSAPNESGFETVKEDDATISSPMSETAPGIPYKKTTVPATADDPTEWGPIGDNEKLASMDSQDEEEEEIVVDLEPTTSSMTFTMANTKGADEDNIASNKTFDFVHSHKANIDGNEEIKLDGTQVATESKPADEERDEDNAVVASLDHIGSKIEDDLKEKEIMSDASQSAIEDSGPEDPMKVELQAASEHSPETPNSPNTPVVAIETEHASEIADIYTTKTCVEQTENSVDTPAKANGTNDAHGNIGSGSLELAVGDQPARVDRMDVFDQPQSALAPVQLNEVVDGGSVHENSPQECATAAGEMKTEVKPAGPGPVNEADDFAIETALEIDTKGEIPAEASKEGLTGAAELDVNAESKQVDDEWGNDDGWGGDEEWVDGGQAEGEDDEWGDGGWAAGGDDDFGDFGDAKFESPPPAVPVQAVSGTMQAARSSNVKPRTLSEVFQTRTEETFPSEEVENLTASALSDKMKILISVENAQNRLSEEFNWSGSKNQIEIAKIMGANINHLAIKGLAFMDDEAGIAAHHFAMGGLQPTAFSMDEPQSPILQETPNNGTEGAPVPNLATAKQAVPSVASGNYAMSGADLDLSFFDRGGGESQHPSSHAKPGGFDDLLYGIDKENKSTMPATSDKVMNLLNTSKTKTGVLSRRALEVLESMPDLAYITSDIVMNPLTSGKYDSPRAQNALQAEMVSTLRDSDHVHDVEVDTETDDV